MFSPQHRTYSNPTSPSLPGQLKGGGGGGGRKQNLKNHEKSAVLRVEFGHESAINWAFGAQSWVSDTHRDNNAALTMANSPSPGNCTGSRF